MTNIFTNKNDPLLDAIRKVMQESEPVESYESQNTFRGGYVAEAKKDDNPDFDKDKKGKLDKVDPKQAKGDFEDRKDKDLDNDGDSDDSDEYLHKRRKAISKKVDESKIEHPKFGRGDFILQNEDGTIDVLFNHGIETLDESYNSKKKMSESDDEEDDEEDKDDKKKKSSKKDEFDAEPTEKDQRKFVDEEAMSDAQKKKREEIVKSMKEKKDDLKKKYGDKWEDVMYATATKMAMKESLDESVSDCSIMNEAVNSMYKKYHSEAKKQLSRVMSLHDKLEPNYGSKYMSRQFEDIADEMEERYNRQEEYKKERVS